MAELVNGHLEVLPMPTWMHQLMVKFLMKALDEAIRGEGTVLDAPLPIRLFSRTIREPDVMYFAPGSEPADPRGYPTHVDLAIEVVSEGAEARKRDYEDKRSDYAKSGISEYWIVDPDDRIITVLSLDGGQYSEHGKFECGQTASSKLLPRFSIEVTELMSIATKKAE